MRHPIVLFLLTILFISPVQAEEELIARGSESENSVVQAEVPLAVLTGEPSAFVNQSVNAISGQYYDSQVDVVLPGVDPLTFQRFYVSSYYNLGGLCNGWNINNFGQVLFLPVDRAAQKYRTIVWDHGGGYARYEGRYSGSKSKPSSLTISTDDLKKGITNSCSLSLSGSTNLKNNRISFTENGKELSLTLGNGTVRSYKQREFKLDHLDLVSEKLPSGNQIFYEYAFGALKDYRIGKVRLVNKQGKELSSLSMFYQKDGQVDVCSHDNRTISYFFQKSKSGGRSFLNKVVRPDAPLETYEYSDVSGDVNGKISFEKMIRKNRPDGRYIINEYYQKGKNFVGGQTVDLDKWDLRLGRVMQQKAPVGADSTPIITHRYSYDIKEKGKKDKKEALSGYTSVWNALNNRTDYHYSEDHRLTSIHLWKGTEAYTVERFFWGKNNTPNSTNLLSRSLELAIGWVQATRTYTYDANGNVLQEKLWGNLTGFNTQPIILDANGIPADNGCQNYTKYYTYSDDGRNLLLTEFDGRKAEAYTYHPDTNLIKSKITWADGYIRKREFFEYDINGVITRYVTDNGSTDDVNNLSGVSERRIKYITPTTVPVGLPLVVEEKYLDLNSNQDRLLSKVVNSYSPQGRLVRQEHFDSNDSYAFSSEFEYDAMGNVTMEKNAIGQVIVKRYDANGNLIYEQGPRQDWHKEYVYDYSNRLIRKDEFHADGIRLTTTYRYDYLGNKTASVDPYGNETRYVYDELGRLTQTISPQVFDEQGMITNPILKNEYDPLDRPYLKTDARGFSTSYQYNIYGNPFQKNNSDGTTEWFEYNLDGSLKKAVAPNGMTTCYTYDYLLRLIKKEIFDKSGQFLSSFSWNYNAFHLLSETDAAGHVTYYQYDYAGRLQSKAKDDSLTTHEYDALGRLVKSHDFYGYDSSEFTTKVQIYDLLNRVIEERMEDPNGNWLKRQVYQYDEMGNRSVEICPTQAGDGVTTTIYNSRGQVSSVTDPMGNQTVTQYRFDYINQLGQRVLYTEIIDPMGQITVNIYDAMGRIASEFKKDSLGEVIEKHDCFYDADGHLCRQVNTIYAPGSSTRTVVNIWSYDSAGRLTATYEAVGTPEQKQMAIGYNNMGQKAFMIKPDGMQILYSYDSLGRLSSFQSSDSSCYYTYEYDLSNNPIRITDIMQGTATLKVYDGNNRLVQEILGNGLTLRYSYDRLGRQTSIILPDNSSIAYSYGQTHLKEVFRLNSSGEKQYAHTYTAYDLSENVLSANLIGEAGSLLYTVDLMGRTTGIKNSNWSSTIQAYDKVGNILQKDVNDAIGANPYSFSYDPLYQLAFEKGAISHQYTSDSLFNRVSKDSSACTLNNLNQLLGDGQATYQYDLNGNLTQKASGSENTHYTYDALDRLICATGPSHQAYYEYDEEGRRMSKTALTRDSLNSAWKSEGPVYYLYEGSNEIGSFDAKGNPLELRILGSGLGAEIGASIAMELRGEVYAPIHDFHGNVVCLVNAVSGKIAEVYRLSAFGEEQLYDAQGQELLTALSPWRFSSKRFDEETGLIYFGKRYYDPISGRWMTSDPIGFEGGPNLYAYVLNAPLTHVDLYGLFGLPEFGAITYSQSHLPTFMEPKVQFNSVFTDSFMNRREPISCQVGTLKLPRGGIGFTNGINNTHREAFESASLVSKLSGGYQVDCVSNPSNGWLKDIARYWISSSSYCATKPVGELHKQWDTYFNNNSDNIPYFQSCHSEGTVNVKHALMSYDENRRQQIIVLAIAPATYIEREYCMNVYHYASEYDFIPHLDVAGRYKCDTLTVLKRHKDASYFDHSFSSPTYTEVIRWHLQDYLNTYVRKNYD